MGSLTPFSPACTGYSPIVEANIEGDSRQWVAACVRSRHEKSVAQHLESNSVENFLPLYETVHRWKDRRAVVQLPLFSGYVFAHIAARECLRVLTAPGVVRLVSFQGRPAAIPDAQIDTLRALGNGDAPLKPHPYLAVGRKVRVNHGPFAGAEGILLRRKGAMRFVLSLDLIARSVALEVDAADVSPILQR